MKAFTADWVCPASSPPIRNATLVADGDRISAIAISPPPGVAVEAFPGCAIIPGLVNVHTHLELTVFRGFLESGSFVDWIRALTRTRNDQLGPDDLRASADLGALECLRSGVTAVGDVMEAGAGWAAMLASGLRGVAYQEVFGPAAESARRAADELEVRVRALGREGGTSFRRLGVSPHAPYSVSEPLYRRVRDLAAREHWPLALHIAESDAEGRFVRNGEGPFADSWSARGIPVSARGVGPLEWVDSLGMLGPETLAIHAIDASRTEIGRLRDTGTSVAHCPKSNLKLGHAIAPLRELLDAGVAVGLGSDSVASNNAVDLFEEMRIAAFLQRTRFGDPTVISAAEVFRLATLGGARCLGLDRELGSLEAGKLADFVVLDLSDPGIEPVYDPIDAIVFSASRQNVRETFLGGERVAREGGEIVAPVRRIAARLRGRD